MAAFSEKLNSLPHGLFPILSFVRYCERAVPQTGGPEPTIVAGYRSGGGSGGTMFRTGKDCEAAGIYRSTDCGYELMLIEHETFPDCPVHNRAVTWTFVKKVDPPKTPRKRRRRKSQ